MTPPTPNPKSPDPVDTSPEAMTDITINAIDLSELSKAVADFRHETVKFRGGDNLADAFSELVFGLAERINAAGSRIRTQRDALTVAQARIAELEAAAITRSQLERWALALADWDSGGEDAILEIEELLIARATLEKKP
jgi:hypothetical protein